MSDPYAAAVADIDAAELPHSAKYRARQVLDEASPDNGTVVLTTARAYDLLGVASERSLRRIFGDLQTAGLIHYSQGPGFCVVTWLAWLPELDRPRTKSDRVRPTADRPRSASADDQQDQVYPSTQFDRPRSESDRVRPEHDRPRSGSDQNARGIKGGRDISVKQVNTPSLPGRTPEQEASFRLLTECLDPPISDPKAADETARRYPFDAIYAQALRWLHDFDAGRAEGPGALLFRIWHPDRWPVPQLRTADYQVPLYADAWQISEAELRRRLYCPDDYADAITRTQAPAERARYYTYTGSSA